MSFISSIKSYVTSATFLNCASVLALAIGGQVFLSHSKPAVAGQWAQKRCAPYAEAVAGLKHHFNEVPLAEGMTTGGQYKVHLFISRKGTWTLVAEAAGKPACRILNGTGWASTAPARKLRHFKGDGKIWEKLDPSIVDRFHKGLR